ncbi:hypothetical protein QJN73_25025, partial [Escherichia coli]|uniref:hypothetical protein n=1 Tax=Escherichia coli TaxID=562 RepID=UPI003006D620
ERVSTGNHHDYRRKRANNISSQRLIFCLIVWYFLFLNHDFCFVILIKKKKIPDDKTKYQAL